MNKPRAIILSASAASCLKACPFKYRNAYYLGIRRIEEPEARRVGSNWHEGQDLMYMKPEQPCRVCAKLAKPDPDCHICSGTGYVGDPLDGVTRMLNRRYETLYPGMSRDARETERAILLYSLFAYKFHYDERPVEVITREMPFRIPLLDPRTHRAVPNVWIDGVIDKLVRYERRTAVMEHKSTSDPVDPSSDYWSHLRLDTQTYIYTYAAQRLQADGLLAPWGIKADDPPLGEILYDAWHKPQIRPKKLSKADTEAFIKSGEYFGREFEVKVGPDDPETKEGHYVTVDDVPAEIEELKTGFAIRETADMFGARLFQDMDERPDYYFGRRLITRSSVDLERFEWELFNLYRSIENYIDSDSWFHNEFECNSYGRCDYAEFCFGGIDLDPKNPPPGFKCIFDKEKK